jgi:hypothetical protein
MRHILAQIECPDKDAHQATPDPAVVFPFDREQLRSGAIAP